MINPKDSVATISKLVELLLTERSRLFSKYTFLSLTLSVILKTLSFSPNLKAASKERLGFRHKLSLEEKNNRGKEGVRVRERETRGS